jgi:hypothetical protein
MDHGFCSGSHSWRRVCFHAPDLVKLTINYIMKYQRLHEMNNKFFIVFDYQIEKLFCPKRMCSYIIRKLLKQTL